MVRKCQIPSNYDAHFKLNKLFIDFINYVCKNIIAADNLIKINSQYWYEETLSKEKNYRKLG